MCRWLAYSGTPLYLEELIFKPEHSLIDQSLHARRSSTATNADGFGVGWYGTRDTPGVYRCTRPAWNDPNLRDIAAQVRSRLFLAHVRAATEAPVQTTNCHPFRYGKWVFVHNGVIRGFSALRRELTFAVASELYGAIGGQTDSELMFFLALTFGLESDPVGGLARMAGFVESAARERGISSALQMTVAASDGTRLVAVRYASSGSAPTLYHSCDQDALCCVNPGLDLVTGGTVLIVSEPLSLLKDDCWVEIPESTALVVEGGKSHLHAFASQDPRGGDE